MNRGTPLKLKTIINLSRALGNTIPCDMEEQLKEKYLSESKGEWVEIGEMDIIHFIRAFNKRHDRSTKKVRNYVTDLLDSMEIPYETK